MTQEQSLLEYLDARIAELRAKITARKTAAYIVNDCYERMKELELVKQKVLEMRKAVDNLDPNDPDGEWVKSNVLNFIGESKQQA